MAPVLLASALTIDILQLGVSLALAAVLTPVMGGIMGFVINTCISLTLGSGHVFGVYLAAGSGGGRLKARILRRTLMFLFGETIPVVNNIPLWTLSTLLAIRDMQKQAARERAANDNSAEEAGSDAGVAAEEEAVQNAGAMELQRAANLARFREAAENPGEMEGEESPYPQESSRTAMQRFRDIAAKPENMPGEESPYPKTSRPQIDGVGPRQGARLNE